MFPLKDGGWRVYRFTKGTEEADTWTTSRNGWTTCVIGLTPTPTQVAAIYHGLRKKKGWLYTLDNAIKAIAAYGAELKVPVWLTKRPRPVTIEVTKSGLMMSVERRKADRKQPANAAGWLRGTGADLVHAYRVRHTIATDRLRGFGRQSPFGTSPETTNRSACM